MHSDNIRTQKKEWGGMERSENLYWPMLVVNRETSTGCCFEQQSVLLVHFLEIFVFQSVSQDKVTTCKVAAQRYCTLTVCRKGNLVGSIHHVGLPIALILRATVSAQRLTAWGSVQKALKQLSNYRSIHLLLITKQESERILRIRMRSFVNS